MVILPQWLVGKRKLEPGAVDSSNASDSDARREAAKLVDLANLAEDGGNLDLALERIRDAIRVDSLYPRAQLNLGNVLRAGGDIDGAIAATQAAIRLDEHYAEAHCNLGMLYSIKGETAAAEVHYEKALELRPRFPEAAVALAALCESAGRLADAQTWLRRALEDNAQYAGAAFNLARLLLAEGNVGDAERELRRALAIDPGLTDAYCILGNLCSNQGRDSEAREWYAKTLDVDDGNISPEIKHLYARAALDVGVALIDEHRWVEGASQLRRAARILPEWAAPYLNLAYMETRQARPAVAIELCRKAIALDPAAVNPRTSLLFLLNMVHDMDPSQIFAEHREFGRWLEDQTARKRRQHANSIDAERTLRVGYVSADYRIHPVAQFLGPLLEDHDPAQVEPFCYSNTRRRDELTRDLETRYSHCWRNITEMRDDEVADLIVEDEIDILIDLSGHTLDSRLAVFVRRPAPVQVSWLGYLNTTGLKSIDYRFVDRYTDPVGETDDLHTERLVRLPHSQWVYWPMFEVPIVRARHGGNSGDILFGSFNQYAKLTDYCLQLWARILSRIPHSRLRIADVPPGGTELQLLQRLEQVGVTGNRVEIARRLPQMQYLNAFNEVDIALDSMPYNGATTTLDTLWMGVPVVGLVGERSISRGTYSILSTLGRTDLIASSPGEYVELNVRLATDADWRNRLHRSLREELRHSPLTDIARFTENLEAAYRDMWRAWCEAQPRA